MFKYLMLRIIVGKVWIIEEFIVVVIILFDYLYNVEIYNFSFCLKIFNMMVLDYNVCVVDKYVWFKDIEFVC